MSKPKWASSERQAYLVRLWHECGNKCLLGHSVCPNPDHYLDRVPKVVSVPQPIEVQCRDRDGKPITITVYHAKHGVVFTYRIKRLYDKVSEERIRQWVMEDREARAYERKVLRKALHGLGEHGSLRGSFNAISRTIYFDAQPQFYLEALGISGLTFRPFAKVRLASSYVRLHVDIADTLKGLSKHKRRKAIRYGKSLPVPIDNEVRELCVKAVQDYLS